VIGTPGFFGERLREAREARGLTATALSEMVGVTNANISHYEHGKQTPSPEVMERLVQVLNCPRSFFLRRPRPVERAIMFYRSMSAATKMARVRAEARFGWLKEVVVYFGAYLDFPQLNVPAFAQPKDASAITTQQIEEMAAECRRFWNLEDNPISDLLLVLENNGIIISRGELAVETIDSFSQWPTEETPYIFLNSDKASAVRMRFDAAHELGHLLLHRGVDAKAFKTTSTHRLMEDQCHRFSLALLLPAGRFTGELFAPTLNGFFSLKERWGVSIAAMIKRCEQLGILDEEQARRTWINLSRRGWRKWEPLDDSMVPESPRVLPRSVQLLVESGIKTKEQMLAELNFSASDLEGLLCLAPGYFSEKSPLTLVTAKVKQSGDSTPKKEGTIVPFSIAEPDF
jgi:Zn-dependent peptidase ImmA (M78 family)/DNA-binding XRE family transcriptional regulator